MGKTKLQRFAAVSKMDNVFEHIQCSPIVPDFKMKGSWNKTYFKNNNPIVLELGCGKGEYTVGLSQQYPDKNFIGLDLKGNRIWVGATQLIEKNIANAGFLRCRIENIGSCFAPSEVSEIWITFADPQPNKNRASKRLTAQHFLEQYKQILKPGGIIHLKTDSTILYESTLDVIQENNHKLILHTNDLYHNTPENIESSLLNIQTHYEKLFTAKGFLINYIQFQLNDKG